MENNILYRIESILKQINAIENDLKGLTYEDFIKSDLLVRGTCFSISQIGEQMSKLEKHLKPIYPNLPWDSAIGMRILIVHIYNKVEAEEIYKTCINDLPLLKDEFIKIRNDFMKKVS